MTFPEAIEKAAEHLGSAWIVTALITAVGKVVCESVKRMEKVITIEQEINERV